MFKYQQKQKVMDLKLYIKWVKLAPSPAATTE